MGVHTIAVFTKLLLDVTQLKQNFEREVSSITLLTCIALLPCAVWNIDWTGPFFSYLEKTASLIPLQAQGHTRSMAITNEDGRFVKAWEHVWLESNYVLCISNFVLFYFLSLKNWSVKFAHKSMHLLLSLKHKHHSRHIHIHTQSMRVQAQGFPVHWSRSCEPPIYDLFFHLDFNFKQTTDISLVSWFYTLTYLYRNI